MNLLIYTHPFAPKTGGVETYVMLLATELARGKSAGLPGAVDVTVVTATPAWTRWVGIASLVCWFGAIVAGRLLAYTYTRLTAKAASETTITAQATGEGC